MIVVWNDDTINDYIVIRWWSCDCDDECLLKQWFRITADIRQIVLNTARWGYQHHCTVHSSVQRTYRRPCATITYRSARYICTIVCMTQAIGWAFRGLAGWSRHQTPTTVRYRQKAPCLVCRSPFGPSFNGLLTWPSSSSLLVRNTKTDSQCLDYKHNWMHLSEKRHKEESNVWKTPCQRSEVLTSSKWSLAVCAWVCADMVVYGPQDPDWVTGTQLRGTVGHR